MRNSMPYLIFCLISIGLILTEPIFAQRKKGDTFRVFYMGGQSNMDGFGYTKDLPDSLKGEMKDVWIYHGNPTGDENTKGGLGLWEELQPGHGIGFSSDGETNSLSDRFGPELSFAARMRHYFPDDKIAIIKYSRAGSSIDSTAADQFGSWEADYRGKNGLNQYDYFLKTIRGALEERDINGDGKEDQLIMEGIFWMQGESDAHNKEVALKYYDNLKRLIDLIRASFREDDLPVVVGKISDSWNKPSGKVWQFGELVQHAQEEFARLDGNAAIVRNTRYYKYSDPYHYTSPDYIDMGKAFAEAWWEIR